jgi:hypothetical protein
MVANSIQKRIAIALESGPLAAPATINWDSITTPGGLWAVTQVDDAALRDAYIENKTVPRRASDQPSMLRGLRSEAQATVGAYLCGQTSGHAATGVQAVRDLTSMVLRAAWGGQWVGYGATMVGGTAAEPEVDTGEGANLVPYGWGYFYDASAGVGHFRQIASEASDVLAMAEGHDLPFTPANGDRVYAVEATYVDWDVAENLGNGSHELLQVLLSGRQADDLFLLYGVKPELQFGAIEQGSPTELTVPLHQVYFEHDELAITPALAQALQGAPGRIVGAGVHTRAWIANVGSALAAQQFWGGIQFTPGVVPEKVRGPNGVEGVHGYGLTADSYKASRLEMSVPFDTQWRTDARAGQAKHFLLQVGNAITSGPWGVYCPRLTWVDDPEVGAESNARRQNTLRFQCEEAPHEGQDGAIDPTGLTATQLHRAKAKFVLLRVA